MSQRLWLSIRNLKRNRRRNLATATAIAVGFASALLLIGYINRITHYLKAYSIYGTHTGQIVIYQKDGLEKYSLNPEQFSLSPEQQQKIEKVLRTRPDIEFFGRELAGTGLIGNGCESFPFFAKGIQPEIEARLREHTELKKWAPHLTYMTKGKDLWSYPPELGGIAVSEGLAKLLGKTKIHDEIPPSSAVRMVADCQSQSVRDQIASDSNVQLAGGTWNGSLSAVDAEIIAQFNTGFAEADTAAVLASLGQLQRLYDTSHVSRYAVWLKGDVEIGPSLEDMRVQLQKEGVEADLYPWDDDRISPLYVGTVRFMAVLGGFIATVLGCIVTLSIFSSTTMTVIERSREIGTLRSLGFTRNSIQKLFAGEVLLLVLVSLVVGGLLGALAIAAVNLSKIQFSPPGTAANIQLSLVPDPAMVLGALLGILALSLGTTWIAVRGITQRNIALLLSGPKR